MEACDYNEPLLFGPEEPICPYTGLRTFTEDEALYFRGREAHVAKCLTLLAAERFVMITGASGDGKSSLAFAGLLPEVRAGFLRARYSNWEVAAFRPERSPLRNMAHALAAALRLESSAAAVETELEQGFSALVQLYQASALYPAASPEPGLPVAEQRRQQRQAANLLVIVDQFEEFFTNPENYAGTGPNTAAQTVVNLLLETTRLAQAEKLPIYIVCTMRSDFVGQCVEFRGLIEQIGTSQYFVPRMLRHEFVEVIKEPALLSGNRISARLVQRLLYDIHFGQDQLPVLQHALRRIWLAADEGREEMDLLHYAMVGGLAADELPTADQGHFAQWQAQLSAVQRTFLLAQPSLRNVLDAHANQLYYEAASRYNSSFQPALPPGTAEQVIERTFRVLTRTDGQRVVRNRLTGAEITAILDDPALPWPVVCHILRPFRQAGTTFLSPFLPEDEADDREVLPPDAVLDITHESLIRNWAHLAEWAESEAEDARIAHDLLQQAARWEANAAGKGFLLPIGPYSYFTQWNARKQLNSNWLSYYLATSTDQAASRQAQAAAQHTTLTRFLEASRRHLSLPLLMARYGVGQLALVMLLVLPMLLAGLGWWAWGQRQQQADYVAYSIINERLPYLKSPYVPVVDKAYLLINADRLKNFVYSPWLTGQSAEDYAFPHQLDALNDDALALSIELSMYRWVNNELYDTAEREHPWSRRLLLDLDRRLAQADRQPGLGPRRRELAMYTARLTMALSYYLAHTQRRHARADSQDLEERKKRLLQRLLAYARQEVATTRGAAPSPVAFGFCLRVLLGQGNFSPAELQFLDGINPLVQGSAAQQQFRRLFPRELSIYANSGKTGHSGGYLTSAIVLAAQRRPEQVLQCLDSLQLYAKEQRDETDGGMALLPYLVKYKLLTADSTYLLLEGCSRVGGVSFPKLYAAAVYSLLSVGPSNYCYAVGPDFDAAAVQAAQTYHTDASPNGSLDPDLLNVDRVSFAVDTSARDKAWTALAQIIPRVVSQQPLFLVGTLHQPLRPQAANYQSATVFLEAFLAKNQGIYLAAIKNKPLKAAKSFAGFSQALAQLPAALTAGARVNLNDWDLGVAEADEEGTPIGDSTQQPVRYLQQPTRPKTTLVGTYFTCAPDAFFLHELQREAKRAEPDNALVQLLDSVAFVEVAYPDRNADTRTNSLQVVALAGDPAFVPNLVWIKAVQKPLRRPNSRRQQRNDFLYTIAAALQDSARLAQLQLDRDVLPFMRQRVRVPGFARVPLRVLLSNLATGLAHAGRAPDAWKLVAAFRRAPLLDSLTTRSANSALPEPLAAHEAEAALPATLATISAIRMGEQAMLQNYRHPDMLLDSFLLDYQRKLVEFPLKTANSIISLLYWRFDALSRLDSERPNTYPKFRENVAILLREGRPLTQNDGPTYACRGRSLADDSYRAWLDAPTYQAESLRQEYFNIILVGLAHLKTFKPGDGWKEYDEKLLLKPADYDGPNE